jgi:hypothetical protein
MIELMPYWPIPEHIKECIRTEAEELAEHTLLAVHEPMRLQRRGIDGTRNCTDADLLEDFLKIERPIPIIGRSGVGKSHLLRWLHAQLKVHPETAGWHIVRIPKNDSLRGVLDKLLVGLEGETFEQVRQQVKTVGEELKLPTVARLLLNFMGDQLRDLYEQAQKEIERHRQLGTRPDEKEKNRLVTVQSHCGDNGLPSLINDTYFQKFLLQEKHCVYQFANRLTSGASDKELGEYDYQIHAKDLDFKYKLNDLAIHGRQYVQTAQLNTNEGKRQEAADMLNLVLGEATRTTFRQLFQFGGSNFQELFKQIRRDLYAKGKTLVVLVEDMAAISAIEDVLIDSLLEEGCYEGVETMCSLRSAIAVTDGYPGYKRRRDTMKTRSTAEWWIEELQDDESAMQERVVDFCSRYINAARYGSAALEQCWQNREVTGWPPTWENEEIDRQYLDGFGRAGTNISLFPLSPIAIKALVHATCRDAQGQLRFNPRQIINLILLKVLREWREDAGRDQFPPISVSEAFVPVALRSDLARLGLEHQGRCETLAAIWGFGANNLQALQEVLNADIALSFGLNDLAQHLRSIVVQTSAGNSFKKEGPKVEKRKEKQKGGEEPQVDPGEERLKALMTEVDLWCQRKKDLAQNEAKALRNVLAEMYETYSHKEWAGVDTLPPIKQGPFPKILIPFALGNTVGSTIEFCSEVNFTDQNKSILFHATARSLLQYSHFNPPNGERRGWNYSGGHEDFLRYQNFAAMWVPAALSTLREYERVKVGDLMEKHVISARTLGILKESDNHRERLNKLLQSQQELTVNLPSPICDAVSIERNSQLEQWDNLKSNWLNLLSSSDHGLEGDLAIQTLKKALKKPLPNRITALMNRSLGELREESNCTEWLMDCATVDDFTKALENLDHLIKSLRTTGKYPPHNDTIVTSQTLLRKVKALMESGNFEQIQKMKQLGTNIDTERKWQVLNALDGIKIKPLVDLFNGWQAVFNLTFPRLQNENSMWGAERVVEAKNTIDNLLVSLHSTLTKIAGGADGNAE